MFFLVFIYYKFLNFDRFNFMCVCFWYDFFRPRLDKSPSDDCTNDSIDDHEEEFYYTEVELGAASSPPTLSHRDMARPPHEGKGCAPNKMIIICTIRITTISRVRCLICEWSLTVIFCFVFGLSSLNIDPEYQKTLIIPRPGSACPMNIPSGTTVNWPFASLNGQVRNVWFRERK